MNFKYYVKSKGQSFEYTLLFNSLILYAQVIFWNKLPQKWQLLHLFYDEHCTVWRHKPTAIFSFILQIWYWYFMKFIIKAIMIWELVSRNKPKMYLHIHKWEFCNMQTFSKYHRAIWSLWQELGLPRLKYRRRIIVWSHVALSVMKKWCRFQSIRRLCTTSNLGEENEVGILKFASDQL